MAQNGEDEGQPGKPDKAGREVSPEKPFAHSDPVTDAEYRRIEHEREDLRRASDAANRIGARKRYGNKLDRMNLWTRYAGAGIQMAASMLLPVLGGIWLDNRFQLSPLGVLLGVALGLATGLYGVIAFVKRMEKREREAGRPKDGEGPCSTQ